MRNIHGKRLLQMVYLQIIFQAETLCILQIYLPIQNTDMKVSEACLFTRWKELVMKLNLRRMIGGGRLFNYAEYAEKMSPYEYAEKVMKGELKDPVLTFELDIGFRFIKILPNYLDDVRSLNYASFIEWLNPSYQHLAGGP